MTRLIPPRRSPALRQAKRLVRFLLTGLNRGLLRLSSRDYRPRDGLTLVFAPHPDDETLGCGGLIARQRYAGWPVHVVFITDGGGSHRNHPLLSVAEVIACRRREATTALALLGVDSAAVHFLDEPDGTLQRIAPDRSRELSRQITALLTALQPAEIFLPCSPDGSSEHDSAHRVIMAALAATGQSSVVWEYPIWAWWNPLILLRRILSPTRCVRLPNGDFTETKRAAISVYVSQIRPTAPWTEPVLPPVLLASLSSGTEYFFRHTPHAHDPAPEA